MEKAFDHQGFEIVEGVLGSADCDALASELPLSAADAGRRDLLQLAPFATPAQLLKQTTSLRHLLLDTQVAVQCSLFAKGNDRNWLVAPHQDLSVPLHERIESPRYVGWSLKQGVWFAQPPIAVLEQLVAVRIQLDHESERTGPLQVVPGSHRGGRLESRPGLRAGRAMQPCIVGRGGVVVLRPLLLHASCKAVSALPRRVLHFVFGPRDLPDGATWARTV